jgi:hypothetical protein
MTRFTSLSSIASIASFVLIASACSDRPITSDDETSSTMADGDSDTTTSGDGEDSDPSANPCGCEGGQLCVGDCFWGDFNPDKMVNPRCIDATVCNEQGKDSPSCKELACGKPWAAMLPSCGPLSGWIGYDIICDPDWSPQWCGIVDQDCPKGEKCVARIPDRWGFYDARCVPVDGTGTAGDPCTSEGADPDSAGTDSCGASSMCWKGSLTAEPFEGTCREFCSGQLDSLSCPEETTCQLVADAIWLCVP